MAIQQTKVGRPCKICNSGMKTQVQNMLMLDWTYKQIADTLNMSLGKKGYITVQNVYDHRKRHIGEKESMLIDVHDARRAGMTLVSQYPKLLDYLNEFIVAGAANIFTEGRLQDKTNDIIDKWLKAIEMLFRWADLEENTVDQRYQQMMRMYEVFSNIVMNIVTPEQREIIEREFNRTQAYVEGEVDIMPTIPKAIEGDSNV